MKKLLGSLVAIAIVITAVPYARSLSIPASPPDISANDWIPLGDAAGFVITRPQFGGPPQAAGTIRGYFVVRQGESWLRVNLDRDMQIQPARERPY